MTSLTEVKQGCVPARATAQIRTDLPGLGGSGAPSDEVTPVLAGKVKSSPQSRGFI